MNNHLDIVWTNQFKKDYKLAVKRHLDIELLDDIIRKLAGGEQLPDKNKDHALTENWSGHRNTQRPVRQIKRRTLDSAGCPLSTP